jgi:hypothetical protein
LSKKQIKEEGKSIRTGEKWWEGYIKEGKVSGMTFGQRSG